MLLIQSGGVRHKKQDACKPPGPENGQNAPDCSGCQRTGKGAPGGVSADVVRYLRRVGLPTRVPQRGAVSPDDDRARQGASADLSLVGSVDHRRVTSFALDHLVTDRRVGQRYVVGRAEFCYGQRKNRAV